MTKANKHRCYNEVRDHPLVKMTHKKCSKVGSQSASGGRLNVHFSSNEFVDDKQHKVSKHVMIITCDIQVDCLK